MRDILRLLNDRSAGDLRDLNEEEVQRLDALCEQWRLKRAPSPRSSPQLAVQSVIDIANQRGTPVLVREDRQ